MPDFTYTVTVEAETEEQAREVMRERILPEEDYEFPYTISYEDGKRGEA